MTCKESTEKILDWIEGELPPDESKQMQRHIAECADCARKAEQLRQVREAVMEPHYHPGEEYFSNFYARLRKRIEIEMPAASLLARLKNILFFPGRWLLAVDSTGTAQWLRPVAVTTALALIVMAALVGTGVIGPWGKPGTSVTVAGVEQAKKSSSPGFSLAVNPQIKSVFDTLNEQEVEALQTQLAQTMLPESGGALPFEPNPVMDEPSLADLNEAELTELADMVQQYSPNLAI